jgi:hypothetical protein
MGGLQPVERRLLEETVAARIGARAGDARELTAAYLDAMERNAYFRTMGPGPVPTSLASERSEMLFEVCNQLQRVIEDFEIQALFRVTETQARAMRRMLLATHSDEANRFDHAWSLVGATTAARRKGRKVTGEVIVFQDEDRQSAFMAYAGRTGIAVERVLGEGDKPWQVIVSDDYPADRLPR